MSQKNYPVRGRQYTLSQIDKLTLRDSPCLLVPTPSSPNYGDAPVQDSHYAGTWLEASKNPIALDQITFTYVEETNEWIPVFRCDAPFEVMRHHLKYEISLETYDLEADSWFVAPKEQPREQYLDWDSKIPGNLCPRGGPHGQDSSHPASAGTLSMIERFPEYKPK